MFARLVAKVLGRTACTGGNPPPPAPAPARVHPQDAWLDAMPDDPYAPCPCGCGKAWRFVIRGGEEEIRKHAETFMNRGAA